MFLFLHLASPGRSAGGRVKISLPCRREHDFQGFWSVVWNTLRRHSSQTPVSHIFCFFRVSLGEPLDSQGSPCIPVGWPGWGLVGLPGCALAVFWVTMGFGRLFGELLGS